MGAPQNVNPIQVDLTSDRSIDFAAKAIEQHFGRLDVLINNAEITGLELMRDGEAGEGEDPDGSISPREIWQRVFDVNVTGTSALTERMIPLLEQSKAPRIVFMTSELSRIDTADTDMDAELLPLILSKAAINRLVAHYAKMQPKFKVNACFLEMSKLGSGFDEDQTAAAEVAAKLVTATDGESGTLLNSKGTVPW